MAKSKLLKSKSGRTCQLSGKKAIKGWRYSFLRSHFNPTSKRRFEVNLQTVRTLNENGTPIKIKVATSVIKKNPEIKLGITNCLKKSKRLKGKKKKELMASLGLLKED